MKKQPIKKLFLVTVTAIAVVLLVVVIWVYSTGGGSNNPLDKPWDARSYEQDLKQALEMLTPDDQTALIGGLMYSQKEKTAQGKTYRDFLEQGRQMQREFMDTVALDMEEFFRQDSLQKDSLRRAGNGAWQDAEN